MSRRSKSAGNSNRWRRAVGRALLVTTATIALAASAPALPAAGRAGGYVDLSAFDGTYEIQSDGTVTATEVLRARFTGNDGHGIYRTITNEQDYPKQPHTLRRYTISDISVTADAGIATDIKTTQNGSNLEIRIGDSSRTVGPGIHTYTLRYTISNALNHFDDHDEFYWNVTGNDWNRIGTVSILQRGPAAFTRVACYAGEYRSTRPCTSATINSDGSASFTNGLLVNGGVTTAVELPSGVITPPPAPLLEDTRVNILKLLGITPLTMGIFIAEFVFLVGGAIAFIALRGRDRQARGNSIDQVFVKAGAKDDGERVPYFRGREIPVQFEPPEDLRPGLLGVLIDEKADTLDVTATIVDLATRGYIRIVEIEPTGTFFKHPDWRLDEMNENYDDLNPYEKQVMQRLFKTELRYVNLSTLKNTFADDMDAIKEALVDSAVRHRWFRGNPQSARSGVRIAGAALLGFTVFGGSCLLGFGIPFILLVPLVFLAFVMIIGAGFMPARTPRGTAVFRQAMGFRRFITESEKYRAQFAERANLFTEYLPYAVVFGATAKWAKTFQDLGLDPADSPAWYYSQRPFSTIAFAEGLSSFAVSSAGTLTSTPGGSGGSGFGGGGFSGGGGGGGGGGGW